MAPVGIRVAVTQHEPVWLDLDGAVKKTCSLIKEASEGGAELIAFPELWIPGYPAWIWYVNSALTCVCFDFTLLWVCPALYLPCSEFALRLFAVELTANQVTTC